MRMTLQTSKAVEEFGFRFLIVGEMAEDHCTDNLACFRWGDAWARGKVPKKVQHEKSFAARRNPSVRNLRILTVVLVRDSSPPPHT